MHWLWSCHRAGRFDEEYLSKLVGRFPPKHIRNPIEESCTPLSTIIIFFFHLHSSKKGMVYDRTPSDRSKDKEHPTYTFNLTIVYIDDVFFPCLIVLTYVGSVLQIWNYVWIFIYILTGIYAALFEVIVIVVSP